MAIVALPCGARAQATTSSFTGGSADGWTYWSSASQCGGSSCSCEYNDYTFSVQSSGGPSGSGDPYAQVAENLSECSGDSTDFGISQTFSASQPQMTLDFWYRASSSYSSSTVTNFTVWVLDQSGNNLFGSTLVDGGTTDSGWKHYTGHPAINLGNNQTVTVVFLTGDAWAAAYSKIMYVDEVAIAFPAIAPPSVPTGVAASPTHSSGSFTVSWNGSSATSPASVASYNVYDSLNGGAFTSAGTSSSTSFNFSPSSQGSYTFQVAAVDSYGNTSANSSSSAPVTYDTTPPSVPGTPVAASNPTAGTVSLSWTASTDPVSGVAGYTLQRGPSGGTPSWTTIASAATSGYSDAPGQGSFVYRVSATNNAGSSSSFSGTSTAILVDTSTPSAPGTPSASPNPSSGSYTVSWAAATDSGGSGIASYELWQSADGTTYSKLVTLSGLSYPVTSPTGSYYYKARAISGVGTVGPYSSPSARELVDAGAPTAPGTPSASPNPSSGSYTVSWGAATDAGGSGIASYELWQSTDGTTYSKLVTQPGLSYAVTSPTGNYYYKARALNGVGTAGPYSSPSSPVVVNTAVASLAIDPISTVTAGQPVAATVVVLNANGVPVTAGGLQITLKTSATATGAFALAATARFEPGPFTITVPPGASQAGFYYLDTGAGSVTLTASSSGVKVGTVTFMVAPGAPDHLALAPGSPNVMPGVAESIGVQVVDLYGNATGTGEAVALSLSGSATFCGTTLSSPGPLGTSTLSGTLSAAGSATVQACDSANEQVTLSGTYSGQPGKTPAVSWNVTDCTLAIVHDAILTGSVGTPYRYNGAGAVSTTGAMGAVQLSTCSAGGAAPAGFQIDPTTGMVHWAPAAPGAVPLCVQAKDTCTTVTYDYTADISPAATLAPPTARFQLTPNPPSAGQSVSFDGSSSSADPGTSLAGFDWSFGDGSAGTGSTDSHVYPIAGGYAARLTVYDGTGASAQTAAVVAVGDSECPAPPQVIIAASQLTGSGSLPVTFSCEGCAGAPHLLWDFGDGSRSDDPSPAHTFSPGRVRVRLVGFDGSSASTSSCVGQDSVVVSVSSASAAPPDCSISVSPMGGPAPLSATFLATYGDPNPGGQIVSAQWTLDDGTHATGPSVSRSYATPGMFWVSLAVTDDQGLTCNDSAQVVVLGAGGLIPPRILTLPSLQATCGKPYQYGASSGTPHPIAQGSSPMVWQLGDPAGGGAPAGMSIDSLSGAISWTPRGPAGTQHVALKVSSPAGSDLQQFDIQVACSAGAATTLKKASCGCGSAGEVWPTALLALGLMGAGRRRRCRDSPG